MSMNPLAGCVTAAVVAAIEDTGDVASAVGEAVHGALVREVRAGGSASQPEMLVQDTAAGALDGWRQSGASTAVAMRGLMMGVLGAAQELRSEIATNVAEATRTVVKRAAEVGADANEVARAAIEGAIVGAELLGLDQDKAAAAAAAAAAGAVLGIGEVEDAAAQ